MCTHNGESFLLSVLLIAWEIKVLDMILGFHDTSCLILVKEVIRQKIVYIKRARGAGGEEREVKSGRRKAGAGYG